MSPSWSPPSRRCVIEPLFALMAVFFAVVAAVWPRWIEAAGVAPDQGDGRLELVIPIVLAFVGATFGLLAGRHWRVDATTVGS